MVNVAAYCALVHIVACCEKCLWTHGELDHFVMNVAACCGLMHIVACCEKCLWTNGELDHFVVKSVIYLLASHITLCPTYLLNLTKVRIVYLAVPKYAIS